MAERHPTAPTTPPPPGGARVTADQQIRIAALDAACRLFAATEVDGGSYRDLEQVAIGAADRFAEWIESGTYDWMNAGGDRG